MVVMTGVAKSLFHRLILYYYRGEFVNLDAFLVGGVAITNRHSIV